MMTAKEVDQRLDRFGALLDRASAIVDRFGVMVIAYDKAAKAMAAFAQTLEYKKPGPPDQEFSTWLEECHGTIPNITRLAELRAQFEIEKAQHPFNADSDGLCATCGETELCGYHSSTRGDESNG